MSNQELEIEQADFKQDAEEVAKLATQESALVEYVPKSKAPYRMNTLIPRNMAFEVQKSLNSIVKAKGTSNRLRRFATKLFAHCNDWVQTIFKNETYQLRCTLRCTIFCLKKRAPILTNSKICITLSFRSRSIPSFIRNSTVLCPEYKTLLIY